MICAATPANYLFDSKALRHEAKGAIEDKTSMFKSIRKKKRRYV